MDWVKSSAPSAGAVGFADLDAPVGKSGANESALLIAILWGIAIALS